MILLFSIEIIQDVLSQWELKRTHTHLQNNKRAALPKVKYC